MKIKITQCHKTRFLAYASPKKYHRYSPNEGEPLYTVLLLLYFLHWAPNQLFMVRCLLKPPLDTNKYCCR